MIQTSEIMSPATDQHDEDATTTTTASPPSSSSLPIQVPTTPGLSACSKALIVFTISWQTFVVTFSSTSLLIAAPEIAADLDTTPEIIDITNAVVIMVMGFSSLVWLPFDHFLGRRRTYNTAVVCMLLPSVGVALAPDFATFTALRIMSALPGTYFMLAGQTYIADIFPTLERGKATGFLMAGTVSGPAIGPCIAGIIVTLATWRDIYWLQIAMTACTLVLSFPFLPAISEAATREEDVATMRNNKKIQSPTPLFILRELKASFLEINMRVFQLLVRNPSVLLANITCGLLSTTQYGILASVRQILNPRFHLTSPLLSGLFYLAPGAGFLIGSIVGGWLGDRTVARYMARRGGRRIPRDRLRSGLWGLFAVLPTALMVYGWGLDDDEGFGGGQEGGGSWGLPAVAALAVGMGVMGSFNALNTYNAEVYPAEKAAVICSKYMIQWSFGAITTGAAGPLIGHVGVGWSFVLFMFLDILGGILILIILHLPE